MKKINKIAFLFILAMGLCMSTGLFFAFSEPETASADTTTAILGLAVPEYNATGGDGATWSPCSAVLSIHYGNENSPYNNKDGDGRERNASVLAGVLYGNTNIVTTSHYGLGFSTAKRTVRLSVTGLVSGASIKSIYIKYRRGFEMMNSRQWNEFDSNTTASIAWPIELGDKTETNTVILAEINCYFNYTLADTNSSYSVSVNQETDARGAAIGVDLSRFNKTGYTLTGFYTDKVGGTQVFSADTSRNEIRYQPSTCITPGRKLYAQYSANAYNVNLISDGNSVGSVAANFNQMMPKVAVPSKAGYNFIGYYDYPDGQGTRYYDSNGDCLAIWPYAASGSIYAYYSVIDYTIGLISEGKQISVVYGNVGSPLVDVAVPTREGYKFAGYFDYPDGVGKQYFDEKGKNINAWPYASNGSIYAHWVPVTYMVAFNANDGTGGMSNQTLTYMTAESLTANTFVRSGYIFIGWNRTRQLPVDDFENVEFEDCESVVNLASQQDAEVTLYAVWLKTWAAEGSNISLLKDGESYIISTPEELGRLAYMTTYENANFSGEKIELRDNIDLSNLYWLPINNSGHFAGHFDGCGHTITGLKTKNFSGASGLAALFGNIKDATVENVGLSEVSIDVGARGAGIASNAENSVIKNCQVLSGNIKSLYHASGIVNYPTSNTLIEDCVNRANITGGYQGGIVAFGSESVVKNCINYGNLVQNENFKTNDYWFGGIAGISAGLTIENCINYGDIETSVVVGGMGGIVALANDGTSQILSCANYGSLKTSDQSFTHIGGIIGVLWAEGLLEYCSSIGQLTATTGVIYGAEKAPTINASYVSMKVGLAEDETKKAFGQSAAFNEGFRYVFGMNNDLPMQTNLFNYASQIEKQDNILDVLKNKNFEVL